MDYVSSERLDDDARSKELSAMLEHGNHKSAVDHSNKVCKLLEKDVHCGFSMVFDPAMLLKIPKAMVQPLGVVEQFTLTASGD